MNEAEEARRQTRVLVLAPTSKDAAMSCAILAGAGFEALACQSLAHLCREVEAGAAVALLTEEALTPEGTAALTEVLRRQPPWSDLPVLVLTQGGAHSQRAVFALERLGNVTLLDRPVRKAMLISALKTALRSRQRQYLLREHLQEQERVREALREADRRKDEFLAMLAHELRNPLAAIVTSAAVLEQINDAPAVRRQQAVIERQARHTARLLDDLLDVSRITQGRIDLRTQRLDLNDVVEQAVASCRDAIEERGHGFAVALPPTTLHVDADPARLEQVLCNLLTNATKYTPPGGRITLRVEPEADAHGSFATIRLHDTGAGMSEQLVPHVFELFTQGERTLARSEGGLGIGLTMVKRLVELHGGTVSAASGGPGLGSEFVVRLPLAAAPADSGAAAPEVGQPHSDTPAAAKILIVEDSPDVAESLCELLEIWGHQVAIAPTGEAALRTVPEFHPQIVLLDIGLPGMDGYETAARLRADSRINGTRIVALSGYGQEEDRRRAEAAGFHHHLTKPVDSERLRALLGKMLSGAAPREG